MTERGCVEFSWEDLIGSAIQVDMEKQWRARGFVWGL